MSLSLTLVKNEKLEHYIKKTYKHITLRFWAENNVNTLCDWT